LLLDETGRPSVKMCWMSTELAKMMDAGSLSGTLMALQLRLSLERR
jgi:hypothetical protein